MKTPSYIRSLFSSIARTHPLADKLESPAGPELVLAGVQPSTSFNRGHRRGSARSDSDVSPLSPVSRRRDSKDAEAALASSSFSWSSASALSLLVSTVALGKDGSVNHLDRNDKKRIDFFTLLPPELTLYILAFVDAESLRTLACVSHRHNVFANDEETWKALYKSEHCWRRAFLYWRKTQQSFRQKQLQSSSTSTTVDTLSIVPKWKILYRERWKLSENWREGKAPTYNQLTGHCDSVYCVQFDREKLVSGSRDRSVKIWDRNTMQTTHTLKGHTGSVLCLQYSGKYLVTGSSDTTINIWNFETGEPIRTLHGHTAGVLDIALSIEPNSFTLSSSSIHLMDNVHSFKSINNNDQIMRVVSCSKDSTIKIWNLETGELLHTLLGHRAAVNAIQVQNGIIASASGDYYLKLWNLRTGEHIRDILGHTRGVACIAFDGAYILSGSNDNTLRLWEASTGRCLRIMQGHTDLVRTIAFDARASRIISGSYDQTVRVWDFATGALTHVFDDAHSSWVFNVQFDETCIVSASQDQTMVMYDFCEGVDKRYI